MRTLCTIHECTYLEELKFCVCKFIIYTKMVEMEEILKVEHIAQVVGYLCHEECTDNGSVIEAAGGWISKGSKGVAGI